MSDAYKGLRSREANATSVHTSDKHRLATDAGRESFGNLEGFCIRAEVVVICGCHGGGGGGENVNS